MMKPVIYLDVDDTILMFPPWRTREWWEQNRGGAPAPHVVEFLTWAEKCCEVRWLTCWALSGTLDHERLATLLKVPVDMLRKFDNPLPWGGGDKTRGINWDEHKAGREWAWVEDGINEGEKQVLRGNRCFDRYYYTNTSNDPNALRHTMEQLQWRWREFV